MDHQPNRPPPAAASPDAADSATSCAGEAVRDSAEPVGDSPPDDGLEPDLDLDLDIDAETNPNDPFLAVPVRYRHDGWTPDRQLAFIEALADGGCVESAARAVGMSRNSAYALRRRPDAQAFRLAWDAALENAIVQLGDAALARAIHGVAVPVFHGGERIGERRQYNERLTMFLLRYRAPERYGRWLDRMESYRHEEGPSTTLAYRIVRMMRAAYRAFDAAFDGRPVPDPENEVVAGFDEIAKGGRWGKTPGRA